VCAAALSTTFFAVPAQADLGDRPLSKGARGADVRALQQLLRQAGFASKADGVFGHGTRRAVVRLERELGLRVDGRITAGDIRLIRTALQPAKSAGGFSYTSETERKARPRAVSAQQVEGAKATLTEDGLAIPPADAPEEVKQVIAAANEIAHKPYRYGGGHGKWEDSGYDCSGSVSYALHGAGLLDTAMPSGSFSSWGEAGEGDWITTYSNGGHIYMVVAGLRFDTSGRGKTGSRWQRDDRSASGFVVRHPEGF
jgi:cell wall-associated NlpC family hydrolase